MQTKKGFILMYTILVGIICLIIMMFVLDIQMSEVEYSTSNKKYVLKDDSYQKNKEYLMTLFFTYITENNQQIKSLGINIYFTKVTGDIVKYENAKVKYTAKSYEFVFTTPYEYLTNRNDYYKLEAIGESFQMVFVKTDYTN